MKSSSAKALPRRYRSAVKPRPKVAPSINYGANQRYLAREPFRDEITSDLVPAV